MVKYIKIENEENRRGKGSEEIKANNTMLSSIKKYLAIGAAALIIGGSSIEYMRNIDYWKPRVQTMLSINSPESLEYRINGIKEDLAEFPQYSDRLVSAEIEAMQEKGLSFGPETYMSMFSVIKDKVEENPLLLDHLGPKALAYQETRVLRICHDKAKNTYQSIKDTAIAAKDKLKQLFTE